MTKDSRFYQLSSKGIDYAVHLRRQDIQAQSRWTQIFAEWLCAMSEVTQGRQAERARSFQLCPLDLRTDTRYPNFYVDLTDQQTEVRRDCKSHTWNCLYQRSHDFKAPVLFQPLACLLCEAHRCRLCRFCQRWRPPAPERRERMLKRPPLPHGVLATAGHQLADLPDSPWDFRVWLEYN